MGISDRKRSIDVPVNINIDLNQETKPNQFLVDNNFKGGDFVSRKKSGNILAGSKLNVDGQGIFNVKIFKNEIVKKLPIVSPGSEGIPPTPSVTPVIIPTPTPTTTIPPSCDFTGFDVSTPTPTPTPSITPTITPSITPTNTVTPTNTKTPTPTPTTIYGCFVASNIPTSGVTGYSTSSSLAYNTDNGYVYANNSNNVNDIITIIDSYTSSVVGYIPMNSTASGGATSSFGAYNPNNNYLYVLLSQSVGIIDTLTNTQIATITGSSNTQSIIYNTNNDLTYVSFNSNEMFVISGTTLLTTITGLTTSLWISKFDPINNRIYGGLNNRVVVIDCFTNTELITILLPGASGIHSWSEFNSDYSKLYVGIYSMTAIYVIDTTTNTLSTTIPFVGGLDGVFVPTNNCLYVTTHPSNEIKIINTLTDTVIQTITGFTSSRNVVYNPSNNYVYVTSTGLSYIKLIDCSTNTIVTTLNIYNPYNSLYIPSTNEVYFTNLGQNSVSIIKCNFLPTPTPTITPTQTPI